MPPPLPPPVVPRRRGGFVLGAALLALVATALVVALVVAGGEDASTPTVPTAVPSTVVGGVPPGETQAVTVMGEPLPDLPGVGEEDAALRLTAPTLSGYSFDGSPVSIEPGGVPKLVVFVAHWCPHCQREVPIIVDWAAQGRVPEGVQIVTVSTAVDGPRGNYPPSKWLEEAGWTWPVLADSSANEAAEAYGLTGFPYFVLVGADGTVKVRSSGELELDQLDALVRAALGS